MFRRALPLFALLAACGTDPVLSFDISSPTAGTSVAQGTSVHLEGVTTLDGEVVEAPTTWTSGDWSVTGNPVDVTNLPVGLHTLTASVVYTELTVSSTVALEIVPGPVDYSGALTAKADVVGSGINQTFDCVSDYLNFTVQPDGALAGEGSCTLSLPIIGPRTEVFTLTGTIVDGVVHGSMTVSEAADQPTNFNGTQGSDGAVIADFDQNFSSANGTLRLYGTIAATPVPL